jgi:hypothetical protein
MLWAGSQPTKHSRIETERKSDDTVRRKTVGGHGEELHARWAPGLNRLRLAFIVPLPKKAYTLIIPQVFRGIFLAGSEVAQPRLRYSVLYTETQLT